MPKPVTYYATGNKIDTLVDCFGSCLEQLTIDDKKALRLILSQYTYASTPSDDYTLEDSNSHFEKKSEKILLFK